MLCVWLIPRVAGLTLGKGEHRFSFFERESLTSIFLPIGNAGQRMGRELNFNRITYSSVGVKISKGCLLRYFVKALDMMCVIAVDLMIEHKL